MSAASSYTNSSLSAHRRCSQLYNLKYNQQLERISDDEHEALAVGTCWHRAHDVAARGGDPYAEIAAHAPGALWNEKLRRLFAAYGWYWKDQNVDVVESERTFCVPRSRIDQGQDRGGVVEIGPLFEGQMDGTLRTVDDRRGLLERKTTGDSVAADSDYWKKLRLDTQVGLYALVLMAEGASQSDLPDFILYDVVRKPTIEPKRLSKDEVKRLQKELAACGEAKYYGEMFTADQLYHPLTTAHEDEALYGARLTSDIGDRPDYYFARREVPRTIQDYNALIEDLDRQVSQIEHNEEFDLWVRNPDACHAFGTCEFFSLCSNNIRPRTGGPAPEGFRRRQFLHPELHR